MLGFGVVEFGVEGLVEQREALLNPDPAASSARRPFRVRSTSTHLEGQCRSPAAPTLGALRVSPKPETPKRLNREC